MKPFEIAVPQRTLDAILAKVRAYEWHEMPRDEGVEGSWAYGANLDFMRALCDYWTSGYDWRGWESELNAYPQFTATVDDIALHFYFEKGSGTAPKPIILSHGWPGSVFEFLHVIDKLAQPGAAWRSRAGCVHGRRAVAARLWAGRASRNARSVRGAPRRCSTS